MRRRMLKLTRFFPRNEFIAKVARIAEPDLDRLVQYGFGADGILLLDRLA